MLMTRSCHSSIRVLTKNIQHHSIHHKNMQLRSTGRTVSLISSREGISEQGDRKHGSRLALNSHTWSWRGKILLSGRLFLLISFRCWLARLPLRCPLSWAEPCSSLISFHICSYVISGWPFPNLGCFPLGAAGALRMLIKRPAWSWAGLKALRVYSNFLTIVRGWGNQGERWELFPHNFSLYFAFPPHAPRKITPHIVLAVEPLLSWITGQFLTNISYWKLCTKLSCLHFPLSSHPPHRQRFF